MQRIIDADEISAAEIILMDGHEETFIEDETMRVKIRYLSRGYGKGNYKGLGKMSLLRNDYDDVLNYGRLV